MRLNKNVFNLDFKTLRDMIELPS